MSSVSPAAPYGGPLTGAAALAAVAGMLDHSMLRPELTDGEISAGLALARARAVASVCVRPCDVRAAAAALAGSAVRVSTVIGFPLGYATPAAKAGEAGEAVAAGCTELDMVLNIGALRSGRLADVQADIAAVVAAAAGRARIKVILETAYLSDAEKAAACRLAADAGAAWVKTSSGFAAAGATPADLRLMRAATPAHVEVKAAGGLRTLDAVLEARACGATRCGATATAAILDELQRRIDAAQPGEDVLLPRAAAPAPAAAPAAAAAPAPTPGSTY